MRLTSFTFPRRALGTLLMFGLLPVAAFAAPITLVNASFETLPPGGLTNSCGSGCSYSVAGTPIAGWSTFMVDFGNGNTYAQLQPGSPANPTYFNTAVPDGTTVTSITTLGQSHSGLIQTVVPTVVLGVTYTLQVDLGLLKASLGVGGVGQALLRIGGTGGFTIFASGDRKSVV